MTTIADVIDRVYRDWLLPPSEQPARFEVGAGGVASSATTLPVDTALLSPEEEDLIGPGTVLEVGSELMLVEAVSGDPATSLTVRRGMYGTTAADHDADDLIYLAPDFPRKVIFDAVADTIEALWPDLWAIKVEETYADSTPVELPSDCEDVLMVRVATGSSWTPAIGWEFISPHPHASTEKALQFSNGANGQAIHVVYRAATTRPTAETDDISDLNVSEGWVKAVTVGAVAQVVAHEDIDRATVEFITGSLAAEGFQAGAGAELRNSLLQYQGFLLEPLKRALAARTHTNQVVLTPFF